MVDVIFEPNGSIKYSFSEGTCKNCVKNVIYMYVINNNEIRGADVSLYTEEPLLTKDSRYEISNLRNVFL